MQFTLILNMAELMFPKVMISPKVLGTKWQSEFERKTLIRKLVLLNSTLPAWGRVVLTQVGSSQGRVSVRGGPQGIPTSLDQPPPLRAALTGLACSLTCVPRALCSSPECVFGVLRVLHAQGPCLEHPTARDYSLRFLGRNKALCLEAEMGEGRAIRKPGAGGGICFRI